MLCPGGNRVLIGRHRAAGKGLGGQRLFGSLYSFTASCKSSAGLSSGVSSVVVNDVVITGGPSGCFKDADLFYKSVFVQSLI